MENLDDMVAAIGDSIENYRQQQGYIDERGARSRTRRASGHAAGH